MRSLDWPGARVERVFRRTVGVPPALALEDIVKNYSNNIKNKSE